MLFSSKGLIAYEFLPGRNFLLCSEDQFVYNSGIANLGF